MDDKVQKPLVSVIIAVYNGANVVGQAIQSVLKQNVPLELIVINDGSRDHIDQVMADYADIRNVIYLQNKKNLGVAASRNIGVQKAQGKYVAFLDADDWWDDGKLEKQLARIQESDTVLCATSRELVTNEGRRTGRIIEVPEDITYHMLLRSNYINCSSVLILRNVAEEFPMKHDDSHEDYLTWLMVLKKYHHASAINEPLLKYRLTSNSKSRSKMKSAWMTFKVYRYMGLDLFRCVYYFINYAFYGFLKYMKAK